MTVIFTLCAQLVVCEWCGAYQRPSHLLPTLDFVLMGKQFLREHRFCDRRYPTPAIAWTREPGE